MVLCEGPANRRDVGDIALDELAVADGFAMPGHEVVEDDDPIAGAVQRLAGMAADVAGASGDQNAARGQRPMEKYVNPSARICSGE